MKVTLLGTGCPIADVKRYGPSALVEADSQQWLVDCGSGVSQRLLAHGTNSAAITGLLLTHLHSDHVVDFFQLLISGWHQGRTGPLKVFGPARTKSFLGGLLRAWEPEFAQRTAHELRPLNGAMVEIEEIDGNWLHEAGGLVITNTEVRHQPIPQAFGFRFDNESASAVISGDTAYCPELIDLAIGCDLLVHEAYVHWQMDVFRSERPQQARDNVRSYHTTTEEVGQVADEAGANSLALTHFVPAEFDRERVIRDVRAHFQGGLYLGEDLMSWDVQPKSVTMLRGGIQGHP